MAKLTVLLGMLSVINLVGCKGGKSEDGNKLQLLEDITVEQPVHLNKVFAFQKQLVGPAVLIDKLHLKNKFITDGYSGEITINELYLYPGGEITSFDMNDVANPGTNGKSGGRLGLVIKKIIFNRNLDNHVLQITMVGQKGGKGQTGLKGIKGEKGEKGDRPEVDVLREKRYCNGDFERMKKQLAHQPILLNDYIVSQPGRGKKGGRGGMGGVGGQGNIGGSSGSVNVALPVEFERNVAVNVRPGLGGDGGDGGLGGEGGDGGDPGIIFGHGAPVRPDIARECVQFSGDKGDVGPQGPLGAPGVNGKVEKSYINQVEIH